MRIFPSVPAAIMCGAIGMPLLAYGSNFIERTSASEWLLLPLLLVTLFVPFFVSTGDLKYLASRWRESGHFSVLVRREDFTRFYIPAWLRTLVWFVSGIASLLLLKAVGVEL